MCALGDESSYDDEVDNDDNDDDYDEDEYTKYLKKRCPDCFTRFATEFDLFNHRISECKPNRAISIFKVTDPVNKPQSTEDSSTYDNRVKILRCQGCLTKFVRSSGLAQHKTKCQEYKKWAKNVSSVDLKNIEKQERHIPITHPCKKCGLIFPRPYNLRRHQKGNNCMRRQLLKHFSCSICNQTSKSLESLKFHMKHEHEYNFDKVNEMNAGSSFSEVAKIAEPMPKKTTTTKTIYSCSICKRTLMTLNGLKNHKLLNCGEKPLLTCKGCGGGFKTGFSLRRHQSKHCPSLKVVTTGSVCCVCLQQFESFELLKEHLEQCHKER